MLMVSALNLFLPFFNYILELFIQSGILRFFLFIILHLFLSIRKYEKKSIST